VYRNLFKIVIPHNFRGLWCFLYRQTRTTEH